MPKKSLRFIPEKYDANIIRHTKNEENTIELSTTFISSSSFTRNLESKKIVAIMIQLINDKKEMFPRMKRREQH